MCWPEGLSSDARVLLHLLRGQAGEGSHAQRLQAFYGPQAAHYDRFRERLLRGRRDLIELLDLPAGARLIELGGGTGRNLLFFGDRLARFADVQLVDLCPALLAQARQRVAHLSNVRVIEADATTYRPAEPADCVFFSYSLTMIPDWRAAIDNAIAMLGPGGLLGVVDFYISRARPASGMVRHGALARFFWPRWFAHDGVRLSPDHLDRLREALPDHRLYEDRAPVPYLPGLRVPFYRFLGRRPTAE